MNGIIDDSSNESRDSRWESTLSFCLAGMVIAFANCAIVGSEQWHPMLEVGASIPLGSTARRGAELTVQLALQDSPPLYRDDPNPIAALDSTTPLHMGACRSIALCLWQKRSIQTALDRSLQSHQTKNE